MSEAHKPHLARPVVPMRRKAVRLLRRVAVQQSQAEIEALRHRQTAKWFLIRGVVVFLMALLPTGPYVQIPLFVLAAAFAVATIYEYERYRISRSLSTLNRD